MITREQWERACKRAGIHRISLYDYPPIGDPASVLQMLEWLEHQTDNGDFESVDGYFDIDKKEYCTRLGSAELIRAYGYGLTKAESIVFAVNSLPEAIDG